VKKLKKIRRRLDDLEDENYRMRTRISGLSDILAELLSLVITMQNSYTQKIMGLEARIAAIEPKTAEGLGTPVYLPSPESD